MTAAEMIAFEDRVAQAFSERQIRAPVHLSGGNEEQLIEIFEEVHREDWVFSTWRSHYHALLHGIDPEWLFSEIKAHGMNIMCPQHRFFTSAIVSGCLPIAVGVAAALKRQDSQREVWCFVGDMAAATGAFAEATRYASGHNLPIKFVVEDNGVSCNTPTVECWGQEACYDQIEHYRYTRTQPHMGVGRWVAF